MNVRLILIYLLLLLLPTQLGRHLFFNFSQIAGFRSDYLAPTLYLSDIIILILIVFQIKNRLKHKLEIKLNIGKIIILSVVLLMLFNSIFISVSPFPAIYKTVKIIEFIILGVLLVQVKPKISNIFDILSIDVFYTSATAVLQFISQKSLGGLFWWLGERSFSSQTPGIAVQSIGGELMLRPYSVFPHPNVLGGFLAIILPLLFLYAAEKIRRGTFHFFWYSLCIIMGFAALILSFSRLAWFVALIGFLLILLSRKKMYDIFHLKKENVWLISFYLLILTTSVFPLVISSNIFKSESSWVERYNLLKAALSIIFSHPFWGVGLNNFIVSAYTYVSRWELYYFQPVHNIYMLVFAESGIIGFGIFLFFLITVFRKALVSNKWMLIPFIQLCILGFFDHYLLTLQQGMLLFTLVASLAFIRENK